MNRRRILRWVRLGVWGSVLVVTLFALWRYDLTGLPAGSCSPVLGIDPEARLLIDERPGRPDLGDVVLFRAPGGGALLLGRVAEMPPSAPEHYWTAVEGGALWIVSDRLSCEGRDSRTLGPIDPAAIEGRVVLSWGG